MVNLSCGLGNLHIGALASGQKNDLKARKKQQANSQLANPQLGLVR